MEGKQVARNLLYALAATLCISQAAFASAAPGRIGAYVTFRESQLNSPYQLRKLMRELKSSGVDFILPFMTKHALGTVNWDSKVAPKELIGDVTYMEKIVLYAHAEGLKVYPVVGVLTEGGEEGPNALLQKNPSWAYHYDGKAQGYIDPGNKDARRYEVDLITELVSKYDVDGLSLDYLRCPNRVGYTETAREYFLKKRKVDLAEVVALSPELDLDTEGGRKARSEMISSARAHPIWPEFGRWRTDQINLLMKEIRQGVDKVKPGLPISSYVWGARTYTGVYESYQDWKSWVGRGWLDWINPSGYRYTDEEFLEAVTSNRSMIPKGFPFYITIGVATSHGRLDGPDTVKRYLRIAAENGADGIIFFRWHSLQPFLPEVADHLRAWPNEP